MEKQMTYLKAILKWGVRNQMLKTIEECSELQKALAKSILNPNPKNEEQIKEELADVQIMLNQMRIMYPFEEEKKKKLKRLRGLLR